MCSSDLYLCKKIIILFLAILYINVSSGIGVQFHYCMGKIVSIALGHHADHDNTCRDCGMEVKGSACCKDESVLIKVKDGHQPSSFFSFDKYIPSVLLLYSDFTLFSLGVHERKVLCFSREKSPKRIDKLFLTIRVLRI